MGRANGYAMFLCVAVRGAGVERVRIVDVATVNRAKSPLDWEIIGDHWRDHKGG